MITDINLKRLKLYVWETKREKTLCRLYYYEEKFSAREPTNKGMEVRIERKISLQVREGGEVGEMEETFLQLPYYFNAGTHDFN